MRLAHLITSDPELAQDIAHEAFVRVAGRFRHLRAPDAFDVYLRRTVVNLCNSHFRHVSAIATALHMPRSTLSDYLPLLETVYSFHRLPAWSRNLTSKVVRHPKTHLTDSGLAAHLLGVDPKALAAPASSTAGPVLQT